ncbi:MAG: YraN family protein [Nitrospiraceae bacterium]|nr:YraN family protein [Nitrospiraceae bacterium]
MRKTGIEGEKLAEDYLKDKAYRIISKNYKTKIGEIDIIADDNGTLVFVEVKTRKSNYFGYPFEAVGSKKQHKLKNLALLYLKKYKLDCPVRFDVISILLNTADGHIEHIKDAFEI